MENTSKAKRQHGHGYGNKAGGRGGNCARAGWRDCHFASTCLIAGNLPMLHHLLHARCTIRAQRVDYESHTPRAAPEGPSCISSCIRVHQSSPHPHCVRAPNAPALRNEQKDDDHDSRSANNTYRQWLAHPSPPRHQNTPHPCCVPLLTLLRAEGRR